jgi:hypothetical protein
LLVKNKNTLLLVFFLLTQLVFGQIAVQKEIHGKINSEAIAAAGINILNTSSQKATVTNADGLFSLFVKEGDILVFSAVNLVTLHRRINKEDLKLNLVEIQMAPKRIALQEVVVNENAHITAENLGIIPVGQKKYTAAERKLFTATSGGGIDGLLNSISGRKAMLKKEIEVEKKEQSLARIGILFEVEYYTKTLKIPEEHIRGFQYYCVENPDFAAALKAKNKTLIKFLIVGLAEKYNQIIIDEK